MYINIYEAVYPYIFSLVKITNTIPDHLVSILTYIVELNPLANLINFQSLASNMKSEYPNEYKKLV